VSSHYQYWVFEDLYEEQKAGVEGASRECLKWITKTAAERKITEMKILGFQADCQAGEVEIA
jgi:hypothetical protein